LKKERKEKKNHKLIEIFSFAFLSLNGLLIERSNLFAHLLKMHANAWFSSKPFLWREGNKANLVNITNNQISVGIEIPTEGPSSNVNPFGGSAVGKDLHDLSIFSEGKQISFLVKNHSF
jgi:hypothetical protein